MSRTVKKKLKDIKAELSYEDVSKELKAAKVAEEDSLPAEVLQKFKPVGNRFQKLIRQEPRSQKVTIRFENSVLNRLKQDANKLGKPYQTHIKDILRTYVATEAPSSE
jgi:predicted DNA binding CopG/RHH family protein